MGASDRIRELEAEVHALREQALRERETATLLAPHPPEPWHAGERGVIGMVLCGLPLPPVDLFHFADHRAFHAVLAGMDEIDPYLAAELWVRGAPPSAGRSAGWIFHEHTNAPAIAMAPGYVRRLEAIAAARRIWFLARTLQEACERIDPDVDLDAIAVGIGEALSALGPSVDARIRAAGAACRGLDVVQMRAVWAASKAWPTEASSAPGGS